MLSSLAYAIDHLDFLLLKDLDEVLPILKIGLLIFVDLWWCVEIHICCILDGCVCVHQFLDFIYSTAAVFCLLINSTIF